MMKGKWILKRVQDGNFMLFKWVLRNQIYNFNIIHFECDLFCLFLFFYYPENFLQDIDNKYELSIVMPCLNEAATVGICIGKALNFLEENKISGEVIVADNGSTDGSPEIAEQAGARVIHVEERGYGAALMGGIDAAMGYYIIMGDSDDSYEFTNLMPFLEKLREGSLLVVGNRFKGGIGQGAMPWHHRYLGNPILSFVGKLFFKTTVRDFHCGLRGFPKFAYEQMDLRTKGMEFASEMIVKATIYDMTTAEVPTTLSPDGRGRKSHLRSWSDGWRHLRFLFIYSPRWIFLYPGFILMAIGLAIAISILFQPKLKLDIHSMLYAIGAIMIGFQAVIFAIITKMFAVHEKLLPMNSQIEKILARFTPGRGISLGFIMVLFGLASFAYSLGIWEDKTFFKLGITITMRIVITSFTSLVLGFQLIFSSLLFQILKLNTR
jgi:glycosyltransferase involved in cell wall biosynthesis